MKTKSILSVIALYWAAAGPGWAASYQRTFLPLPGGVNVFANQLDNGSGNTLNQLFSGLPSGSKLFNWNGSSYTTYTKTATGWLPPAGSVSVGVGEGWVLQLLAGSSPITITFSGSQVASPITRVTAPNTYHFLGSQAFDNTVATLYTHQYNYFDITANISGPLNPSALYKLKGALWASGGDPTQFSSQDWQIYIFDGTWHPYAPTIQVGDAVWIGPEPCRIKGTVRRKNNSCVNQGALENWHIVLTEIANGATTHTFTDASGNYKFYALPNTSYMVTQVTDPCYMEFCDGVGGIPVTTGVNPGCVSSFNDFGAKPMPAGVNPDVSVQVFATYYVGAVGSATRASPCCGGTIRYRIRYRNHCATATSVIVNFDMPTGTSYQFSNPFMAPCGGQTRCRTFATLNPSQAGVIILDVNVACNPALPPVLLVGTAWIPPVVGELSTALANNTAVRQAFTKCSFDPNDKEVTPKGCGPAGLIGGDQLLTYTVQFQNLGSGPAFDVVVRDRLDDDLDLSTLEVLGTSHNAAFELNGREMVWTFPEIYLPAAIDDEPGSHGFLSYRVKSLSGLAEGTVITNRADIYFDNNPPVLTPITTNTVTLNTAPLPVASFTVAPRPGSAGHTNDFTYTGGTAGATFLWDFGPDATPPTSTVMNPSGVVFATDGLRNVSLQVALGGCDAEPASYLLSVGQPKLAVALSENQVCLSWDGDGYSLQETATLDTPIPWQTIHPPISVVERTHSTCLDGTNTFRFYRLTDQP